MNQEPEGWRRAVAARDARFDGRFVVGVTSTGIYCRPSCPARTPRPEHLRFHPTAASAQAAGFRACLRCRPDAAPGSPEWDTRADLAGRAMRLIGDGVVEREGVGGLARRLHVGERHLRRVLTEAVGCGPLALARAERARTARVLIETTDLPFGRVAFASGFGSLRQFNDTVRAAFGRSPTELRRAGGQRGRGAGVVSLRLAGREPLDVAAALRFLAARTVAGVEEADDGALRRIVSLPHGAGVLTLRAEPGGARLDARLDDLRDLPVAVSRARRLLDLDADPVAVDGVLALDPLLARLVAAAPGTRVPSGPDPFEAAVRVVVGQQVSVAAARTALGRIVADLGEPLAAADGGLTHRFPAAEAIADCDPARLPLPGARARALVGLARSPGVGWCSTRAPTGTRRGRPCARFPDSAPGAPR
jgi:AraC family transcriptional regulator of adaptative response / DNA-3-methyladenine glycosylase II